MLLDEVKEWLKENNKGDLQECTWEELNDLQAFLDFRHKPDEGDK